MEIELRNFNFYFEFPVTNGYRALTILITNCENLFIPTVFKRAISQILNKFQYVIEKIIKYGKNVAYKKTWLNES